MVVAVSTSFRLGQVAVKAGSTVIVLSERHVKKECSDCRSAKTKLEKKTDFEVHIVHFFFVTDHGNVMIGDKKKKQK